MGSAAVIVEAIGDHPFVHGLGESPQHAESGFVLSCLQHQAGNGDHCVSSPIGEPGISGDNGVVGSGGPAVRPRNYKDITGRSETTHGLVGIVSDGLDEPLNPLAFPLNGGVKINFHRFGKRGGELHCATFGQAGLKPSGRVEVFVSFLPAGNLPAVTKTIPPLRIGMELSGYRPDRTGRTADGDMQRTEIAMRVFDTDTIVIVKVGQLRRFLTAAKSVKIPQ